MRTHPDVAAALYAWGLGGRSEVTRLSGGHINDSFRVEPGDPAAGGPFLLQRLNDRVFPRPRLVMQNVTAVTTHLLRRLGAPPAVAEARGLSAARGVGAVPLVPTRRGASWHVDRAGGHWRLVPLLRGVVSLERPRGPDDAREAARAYGAFLAALADWDGPPLSEVVPGFHDTAGRLDALRRAAEADELGRAGGVRAEVAELLHRRALAAVLPPLLESGEVPTRIAHNDAKLSNVLLDERTGRAVAVVDLDTVMPGTGLHDFGDMVRSTTCTGAEDEAEPERMEVRAELYAAVSEGWLETAGDVITPKERELMGFAGRLITLEQSARFLTDYLEGDRYYATSYADQNLRRARAQLRLLQSLEALEGR